MRHILIFAGTTEGRCLAEHFQNRPVSITFCVATEYGKELLPQGEHTNILAKRLNATEMARLMTEQDFDCVVDATHPYAMEASVNIRNACRWTQTPYFRIERQAAEAGEKEGCVYVDSVEAAAAYLNRHMGIALLTTGSKELKAFTQVRDFQQRLFARILPIPHGLEEAIRLGFPAAHLYGMQGPFSATFNAAMLQEINAAFLVTKESGEAGGFAEKLAGAKQAGTTAIVIKRPRQQNGFSVTEMITWIETHYIEG